MPRPQKAVVEDDLCRAIAEKVDSSDDFKNWLLHRTKFANSRFSARLLKDEQVAARPKVSADRWWRHWFWNIPELEKEHETDVFLLFEEAASKLRFALHVEVKLGTRLSTNQAASYGPRGRYVVASERRVPHSDFASVFVASQASLTSLLPQEINLFDAVLSHEEVGIFLPVFDGLPTRKIRLRAAS